jgi:hypothetical protein
MHERGAKHQRDNDRDSWSHTRAQERIHHTRLQGRPRVAHSTYTHHRIEQVKLHTPHFGCKKMAERLQRTTRKTKLQKQLQTSTRTLQFFL